MMRIVVTLCVAGLLAIAVVLAAPAAAESEAVEIGSVDVAAANQAYESGDFSTAAESYQRLLQDRPTDATLHYNLGCALARQQRFGLAVLAFRRALLFNPRHEDARANLSWVQQRLVDRPETNARVRDQIARWSALVPLGPSLVLAVVLEWCGALLLVFAWWKRKAGWWKLSVLLFVVGLLIALGPITRIVLVATEKQAVVTAVRAEARSGPGDDFPLLFTAHEGFEVEAGRERAGWVRIRAAGGLAGWLQQESVVFVHPSRAN